MRKILTFLFCIFMTGCVNNTQVATKDSNDNERKEMIEQFKKACNAGEPVGCYNLGIAYYSGDYVEKDYKKSAQLYHKACDSKVAFACFNLGFLYENGKGVNQDSDMATALYKKACEGGDMKGCHHYAISYATKQEPDHNEMFKLFKKLVMAKTIIVAEYLVIYMKMELV